jgi:hypothetical protein
MKKYPKILLIIGLLLFFVVGSVSAVTWITYGDHYISYSSDSVATYATEMWNRTDFSYANWQFLGTNVSSAQYLIVGGGGAGGVTSPGKLIPAFNGYTGMTSPQYFSDAVGGGGGGGGVIATGDPGHPALTNHIPYAITVGSGGNRWASATSSSIGSSYIALPGGAGGSTSLDGDVMYYHWTIVNLPDTFEDIPWYSWSNFAPQGGLSSAYGTGGGGIPTVLRPGSGGNYYSTWDLIAATEYLPVIPASGGTASVNPLIQGRDGGSGAGGIGTGGYVDAASKTYNAGGGGGGSGGQGWMAGEAVGSVPTALKYTGGKGGQGRSSDIAATSEIVYYGGGGGGACWAEALTPSQCVGGSAGIGGGGIGQGLNQSWFDWWNSGNSIGTNRVSGDAVPNTGGGGGAGGWGTDADLSNPLISPFVNLRGGTGGSGIVFIRYILPPTPVPGVNQSTIYWTNLDRAYVMNDIASLEYEIGINPVVSGDIANNWTIKIYPVGSTTASYTTTITTETAHGYITNLQLKSPSFTSGTDYVAVLSYKDPVLSQYNISATDTMKLSAGLGISGKVMNAENGSVLNGASVKITQSGAPQTVTSYSDGAYSLSSGLAINLLTTIETSKTGFTTDTFQFTPTSNTAYVLNISLVPTVPNFTGSAILGIVRDGNLKNLVPGVTVTATNATSVNTTTTNIAGYYKFNNLASGSNYQIYGTHTLGNSDIVNVTAPAATFNRTDLILTITQLYRVMFTVKDTDSGVLITNAVITDDVAGSTAFAAVGGGTGQYYKMYPFGDQHRFTAVSTDYYTGYFPSSTGNIIITGDYSDTFVLRKVDQGGGSVSYSSTQVTRFMCKDWQGNPVVDMNATMTKVETTLGSLDWFSYLFGINLDKTSILNTTMTGTTDSSGSVSFVVIPVAKYSIHYEKPAQSINETRYYYPRELQYDEIFWSEAPTLSSSKITSSFYNTTNGTYMDLGVRYTDTSATDTTSFTFFVRDENHNLIYTNTNVTPGTSKNISYPVLKGTNGEVYYWGFSATSASFTDPINRTNYIHFDEARWKLDPMCPSDGGTCGATVATREFVYNGIAVIMINIFAYIFGRRSIKAGLVVVAAMGLFFYYIGWLQTTVLLMGVAFSLAVIWYIRFAEQESPD